MALKPQEVKELATLTRKVDFLEDIIPEWVYTRREALFEKATREQVLAALRIAGYEERSVWDTYPQIDTAGFPSLAEAVKMTKAKGKKKAKKRRLTHGQ